uniref:Phospholipase-like protein n=1 Tax=Tanacetum cinerariifolium TaxID=118510 RepID=A0A699GRF1_TANCI|nr:phospholipase-like protein [Tanacetum cinerariifolium]
MLRRQHKVDDQHHDMPLIYYMEGHNLHFGRREFSLIIGFRFGTVSFDLHSFGELKFQNRVFSNKIGFSITNLDIIGVIEDEEMFGKLSDDDDAIRLCLFLVENIEAWNSFPWGEHLWCHLYDEIKNLKERRGDEHYYGLFKDRNYVPTYTFSGFMFTFQKHHGLFETYLSKLEKARKRRKTGFMVSSIGGTTDNIVRKKWLNDLVIMELNFRLFKLETIIQVLAHERSDRQAKLKFTDEFSSMTFNLCDSLNNMFADLIEAVDPDEDIALAILLNVNIKLFFMVTYLDLLYFCIIGLSSRRGIEIGLEGEEKMRFEHQKLIVEDNRIRLDEAKTLRLEEENMLQLEQQNKNKRKEFMNSSHCKNLLFKLAHAKRIQLCSSSEKIKLKSIETVWLSDDIECFLAQSGQIKCKFSWNDDYIADRNFWLKLVCLDLTRKGWLTEEVQLPVVLEREDIFQKNGIDTSKYTITFRLADNVPKQGAYMLIVSKVTSHEKLKSHGKLALMAFYEIRSWEKEQSLSLLLRTPPLKKRRKGIAFQGKNLYAKFLHADCVDDHFDVLEEPVGCDGGSLLGKIKDEFSNEVILDDVVSSPATLLMLLKRKVDYTMTQTTSMKIDSNADVAFIGRFLPSIGGKTNGKSCEVCQLDASCKE